MTGIGTTVLFACGGGFGVRAKLTHNYWFHLSLTRLRQLSLQPKHPTVISCLSRPHTLMITLFSGNSEKDHCIELQLNLYLCMWTCYWLFYSFQRLYITNQHMLSSPCHTPKMKVWWIQIWKFDNSEKFPCERTYRQAQMNYILKLISVIVIEAKSTFCVVYFCFTSLVVDLTCDNYHW